MATLGTRTGADMRSAVPIKTDGAAVRNGSPTWALMTPHRAHMDNCGYLPVGASRGAGL